MGQSLPKTQAAVLSFVFEHAPIEQTATTVEFSLAGAFGGTYHAAHARLVSQGSPIGVSMVFTLATHSDCAFLSAVSDNPIEIARALANLEDYEREGANFGLGDVVLIPDVAMQSRGLHATLLIRVCTFPGFRGFPDHAVIDGRKVRFALVVFLSADEYEYRRKHGHDALMDKFEREDRLLVVT